MISTENKVHTDFLAGAGDMGARIRAFDWTRTPLGELESWPQSLKTSISLILSSRHPMWIGWGPEMTFLYNDAYLHVLGPAKHPGALGRPASEVWAEIWDVCGPLADKVFETGEASFVDDVHLFMDRGDFLEETFYSFSYSPIRDESGNISGLFCPSTDVTPKILHARRLRTLSELATKALAEKTTAGAYAITAQTLAKNPDDIPFALLYLVDPEGYRAFLEQIVGSFANDHVRAPIIDLTAPADPSVFHIGEVFRTAQRQVVSVDEVPGLPTGIEDQRVRNAIVLPVTARGKHKPGGILVAGVNPCRPLDDEYLTFFDLLAAQMAIAVQNARTVEEETKRADMLAEIDRAKTAFFSNVSHEFRTPLTLMLDPLENVLSTPDNLRPDDYEQLAIAHRNSLRLLKLVNSLLDFSRLEAGRTKASYAPVDLSSLTADLASNFRSTMQAAGLNFITDTPPLPQPVFVDREMWEKIVLNLLSNAFKFTFQGSVTLRVRHDDHHAVLEISDTGTGIPERELPRIFERFHRIEGATGRTYEGTGIGLALVQEFVKLHGGSIFAESRLGEGSTFTVSIPFGSAHLAAERIESQAVAEASTAIRANAYTEEASTWISRNGHGARPAELGHSSRTKARILLAEDNADMREHIARILSEDYEIDAAEDGEQALQLVRAHPPDLLLSDVMMPKLDGFELLQAVRADAGLQTLPVILISARAGEEARIEGVRAGADDYLIKPFTAYELRARVKAHMEMAFARRRAIEQQSTLRTEAESARDQVVRLLESITDGFIALDSDWRLTYVNAEAERLNAMRREEMLGRSLWDVFPASLGTVLHREFLRAAAERVPVEFENLYEPWQRWFHVKAYPALDGGLSVFYDDITGRKLAQEDYSKLLLREREAREEAETLNEVSRQLAGELDLEKLLQIATDAATKVTGAEFGAFFYNVLNEAGESYLLYTLSGVPREAFEKFELPGNTPVSEPTCRGTRVVRSEDIVKDPNYGKNPPHHGMPSGHLPVRSYLEIPVKSRSGEVLGELFFGHSKTGVFGERAERIAIGIASHAALAIDNARLFAKAEQQLTRRNEVEKALRESEQHFREMIDALPAAIYTTDAEGRLTHFNPAAIKLSGRVPELGTDQWCVTWKLFNPDGTPLPHDSCPMAVTLKEGRPVTGAECIAERPDGTRFWFTAYPTCLRDSEGRVVGGINMLVDITERKATEEALRRSEERFRGIFDSSAVGVAVLTLDGRFLQANKAFCSITEYREEELHALDCINLTHQSDREAMRELIAELVSGESPSFIIEVRYLRRDGRAIWVQNSISAMRDVRGRPEYLIALSEDVTMRKQAEFAMRESEERFRAIVDTTPECVKLVAPDGTLIQMNSSGLAMLGAQSAAQIVGGSVYDLIAPEHRDRFREFNQKICAGEKGSLEFDIIGLQGQRRQMETHAAPFCTPNGMTVQLSISRDITERKHAERATLLLRAIVDSSDDAIVSKDLSGIITSWNKGAERLFGYTADEVIGQSITIIIPPDRLGEEPDILARLQRGERVDHFETIRRRKDGSLRNISLTISPVKDKNGTIIGASKIARDITERKLAEQALLASESRFRQLADSMPQIVWTARPDGYLDYYNNRWYEFTGFGRDKFGDASWQPILHPEDVKRCQDEWYACVNSGQPYRIEYRFWDRHENRWRWFMGRALPVRDEYGKIIKWFGSSTDIDEQKRIEAELRSANQDLEQFAYSASHDLQEPLRGIKIYGELLTRRYAGTLDGQAREFLGYLSGNATRMEMLIRDLLAYTQVSKLQAPDQDSDANAVLAETLANLSGAIMESEARVTSDALPSIRVHDTHLKQLFQNLIGNAIKYRSSERIPTVHISAGREGGNWLFSVADNGIGIEPEYKERIFGLFKRLHTGDEYSGTGIGLAICQRIVERYHGRIWVESVPGKGSKFMFTVPV